MRPGIKPLRAVLVTLALGLLALPASALAAPPANDDFAQRMPLPFGLPVGPIEVSASNVEATKEAGEAIPGLSPAGHSIWFEWEPASTGWVSVGLCGTQFPTILDVFTGSQIDDLTSVLKGDSSVGPDCPGGDGVKRTFRAEDETRYVIVVDGNSFFLPGAPAPVTEGPISLQLEATPPPANDAFADAEVLQADVHEEPGGDRFYFVSARGNNWTATTELGEPFYGPGAGASVWYRWTPPESGKYLFSGPCCGADLKWALFSGESIGTLTSSFFGSGSGQIHVTAGQSYRISVFANPGAETGEPVMGGFNFTISAKLPPLPKPLSGGGFVPPPPPLDLSPPQTIVKKRVLKRKPPVFVFRFKSTEAGSTFRCSLDRRAFKPCGSSRVFSRPMPGRHRLRVQAVDAAGNADPTPAVARFKFPPRHKR